MLKNILGRVFKKAEIPYCPKPTSEKEYPSVDKLHIPPASDIQEYISTQDQRAETLKKAKLEWLDHLVLREGINNTVYLDSLGKPTVGVGHLIPPSSFEPLIGCTLKVGDIITQEECNMLLDKDSEEAWSSANLQANLVGRTDLPFIQGLASVCFQLGSGWTHIHKKTWALLLAHEWQQAAQECEDSMWYKQTPVRVRDFQECILASA